MNDLIRRHELLKLLTFNDKGERIPERDCDNFPTTITLHDIKKLIREQPTAYDVDKVVERLGKLPTCSNWNHNSNNIDRRLAIEIVKEGGVNE